MRPRRQPLASTWWRALRRDRTYRSGHGIFLVAVLAFASGGFVTLSSTAQASRLEVRGRVAENTRAAYDILIRPKGSRLPQEETAGLVQPGFLGAGDGGISLKQWRTIQAIRGVEVAAPVAIVGYVTPSVSFELKPAWLKELKAPVVLRRSTIWSYDNGASAITSTPQFEYVTPFPVKLKVGAVHSEPTSSASGTPDPSKAAWVETTPDGRERVFPIPDQGPRQLVSDGPVGLGVGSTATTQSWQRFSVLDLQFPFPFLLAAVDPEAEARLSGLDTALIQGTYLKAGLPAVRDFGTSEFPDPRQPVPVLVASQPLTRLRAQYRIERLPDLAVTLAQAGGDPAELAALPGRAETAGIVTEQDAYRKFLDAMPDQDHPGSYYTLSTRRVIRAGPVKWKGQNDLLTPKETFAGTQAWGTTSTPIDVAETIVAPGGDDTAFRDTTGHLVVAGPQAPALVRSGVFDASKLAGNESLGRLPLGTYSFDPVTGADPQSQAALGDQPWYPSANLSGYQQPPPMMITSLDAMSAFTVPGAWSQIPTSGQEISGMPPVPAAPISAIRVRVSGVSGVDDLSRERLRAVAEEISTTTGLQVDITVGSSPSPQRVSVQAGKYGRPALNLTEPWVKKGVAVELISAADRKSVLLSAVILLVCALVVANASFTSVRSRRREIGTLQCLGWSMRAVFASTLLPLLVLALLAGLIGAVAALGYAQLTGTAANASGNLGRAALAVPTALVVSLLAGAGPAWWAARLSPTEAVRAPSGSAAQVARRVRGVTAWSRRTAFTSPGRAATVIAALAVATAALASVWMIIAEFHGRAVGSLLGDAVTVQVGGQDLVAVVVLLSLSGVAVIHSITSEIRERSAEFAVLEAMGWRRFDVVRLILAQAAILGAVGSIIGVGVAWAGFRQFADGSGPPALSAAIQAGAVGIVVALAAAFIPACMINRLAAIRSLSED